MQAVILAGGAGTRLSELTGNLPKALVDIAGKPLLHWQIELLARHGFSRILLLVKHGADFIRASCGDGAAWGISIEYVEEAYPRGTAGALLDAVEHLDERFVVLYGDTVLNVDLGRMWTEHQKRGADATLFVHPNDHPHNSDIVETDATDRIVALHLYPHPPDRDLPNLVNAALYILEKTCLVGIPNQDAIIDLAKYLFPILLANGRYLSAYQSREYIKDAGTGDRLAAVVADVVSGRVARGSMETPAAAVFLDRDGTLVDDPGYIIDPDQVQLFPGVGNAIRRLNRSGYLAVMVTNQPVIARGETDEPGLKLVHNRLERMLGRERAYLDAIYYCPHHPDRGFPGENEEYKITCECRKPSIGMIERARADMNVDQSGSWLIGDTSTDVETARRACIRSVVVGTGHGGRDGRYPQRSDFEFLTVGAAVDFILDSWPHTQEQATEIAHQLRPGDVVLIGGLARCGKSIFASTLAWRLRQMQPRDTKVISLDGWIKPLKQRVKGTVVDRFEMRNMEAAICSALAQAGTIDIPLYDRQRRGPDKTYPLKIGPDDIVILEGVVALLLRLRTARRVVRIYAFRHEELRREVMAADYRAREFTDEQFAQLFAERQVDEAPIVSRTLETADFVVELK